MSTEINLESLRVSYQKAALSESSVAADPIIQFRQWFDEAVAAKPPEPNAMVLATVDAAGNPAARVVLLKGISMKGFTFFTNYQSRKGHELSHQPAVALLFYWGELERQVRIEGTVEQVPHSVSKAYFSKRPRGSQLGSYASPQSAEVSREALEQRYQNAEKELQGKEIPCPTNWGGYLVRPTYFEFWQGRENRLHDRITYRRDAAGGWKVGRLAP